MHEQNKYVSLFISTEHLIENISEFCAFKKKFDAKVNKLTNEAMAVVSDCVATNVEFDRFDQTRAA